ncbi:MAG: DUF4058 family protein [Planctomycetes bacterium]|nr:DUF4058 family protein [Planctomycetota bacterium]
MPSPFPGMDPVLESPSVWGGFHHEFASALRHDILPHLPPRYFVP